MKKIFAYVGSYGGEESNTVKFLKLILDKVCSRNLNNIKYKIYTPRNTNINRCVGCLNCFMYGKCIFKNEDDMEMLKTEMLKADFIVWGSPIYSISVSGDMKHFIDRISYWTHLMRLAGKPALAVTTSSGNGVKYTLNYMYTIMSFMGLKVVKTINGTVFSPSEIHDGFLEEEVNECADMIYKYLMNIYKVESDDVLEKSFRANKKNILGYGNGLQDDNLTTNDDELVYEYKYWNENGYLKLDSFQSVIDKITK